MLFNKVTIFYHQKICLSTSKWQKKTAEDAFFEAYFRNDKKIAVILQKNRITFKKIYTNSFFCGKIYLIK